MSSAQLLNYIGCVLTHYVSAQHAVGVSIHHQLDHSLLILFRQPVEQRSELGVVALQGFAKFFPSLGLASCQL